MSSPGKLSPGVIAAAVTGLFLGAIALLGAVFFFIVIAVVVARRAPSTGPLAIVVAFFFIVILLGAGISCLAVSIGLLLRKNWARIGALVWAGIVTALSACGMLIGALAALRSRASPNGARFVLPVLAGAGLLIGVWWLLLFARKEVAAQFANPANITPADAAPAKAAFPPPLPDPPVPTAVASTQRDPFSILKARWVFLALLLSLVATLVVMIVGTLATGSSFGPESPLRRSAIGVILYGSFIVSSLLLLWVVRLKPAILIGSSIGLAQLRRYWVLPLFLPAVSIAGYFLLYWPLSFAMPRFVSWRLFREEPILVINTHGAAYWLPNLLTLFIVVVLAPVVEEFIFRGLLLTRWSLKWGAPRAILVQAIIFGLLHKEFLGHVFFGFVMAVLYVETKSLLMPILMHAANNAFAWFVALLSIFGTSNSHQTLAEFQKRGGVTLILAVVFVPLASLFLYRHFPKKSWRMPYTESELNRDSDIVGSQLVQKEVV